MALERSALTGAGRGGVQRSTIRTAAGSACAALLMLVSSIGSGYLPAFAPGGPGAFDGLRAPGALSAPGVPSASATAAGMGEAGLAVAGRQDAGGGGTVRDTLSVAQPAVLATPLELTFVDMVNADRVTYGLPPVAFDVELLPVARARAAAQVPLPGLSHWDALGRLAFVTLLMDIGASYQLAGENLARLVGGAEEATAGQAERALMSSPTHRANILEPTFNRLAVGTATDSSGRMVFAQIFRAAN